MGNPLFERTFFWGTKASKKTTKRRTLVSIIPREEERDAFDHYHGVGETIATHRREGDKNDDDGTTTFFYA